jgi:hypothetical protein
MSKEFNFITFCTVVNHTYMDQFELVKGKAIPLQAWTGPEGSRSLRLPVFKPIGK